MTTKQKATDTAKDNQTQDRASSKAAPKDIAPLKAANDPNPPTGAAKETFVPINIHHEAYGRRFKGKLKATFAALEQVRENDTFKFLKGAELFNALASIDGIIPLKAENYLFEKPVDVDEHTAAIRKWDNNGLLTHWEHAGQDAITDREELDAVETDVKVHKYETRLFNGGAKLAS